MKSELPKVLHGIGGLTLIEHVLRTAAALQPASITVVVGHGAEQVRTFARQAAPSAIRHTGTAARDRTCAVAGAAASGRQSRHGRVALGRRAAFESRVARIAPRNPSRGRRGRNRHHRKSRAALRLWPNRPHQGPNLEDRRGARRDDAQKAINEINSGIYAFDLPPLFAALDSIGTANKQGEYYLPDLVAIYRKQKRPVATWTIGRPR